MIPVYLPELDPVNQDRVYIVVSFDGSSCIMEPAEAEAMMKESPGVYSMDTIRMTPSQFEKLDDFAGW